MKRKNSFENINELQDFPLQSIFFLLRFADTNFIYSDKMEIHTFFLE